MGLITSILKRTETRVVKGKYNVRAGSITSRSDVKLFEDFVEIAAKMKHGKRVSKEEYKRYKYARRRLRDRGILGQVTEEVEPKKGG